MTKETEKAMELASAYAYLTIAKHCVENARTRLRVNVKMGRELLNIYDTLDVLLDKLHEENSEKEDGE